MDPWLDTEEIRDGRPWLKMIFEDGIPSCDSVLVYFTEHSLRSRMVSKEIDATLVEQLANNGISFLPYVNESKLRANLRSDIRTLHCREWNAQNYSDLLPSVVAEIWRGYLEKTVRGATIEEENHRLRLELELRTVRDRYESSVFANSENSDFGHICKMLDRRIEFTLALYDRSPTSSVVGHDTFELSLLGVLARCIQEGQDEYDLLGLNEVLIAEANRLGFPRSKPGVEVDYAGGVFPDVKDKTLPKLKAFGLVKGRFEENQGWKSYSYELTDKMFRFMYWLSYNNRTIGELSLEYIEPNE
jgi:hypothetical protein